MFLQKIKLDHFRNFTNSIFEINPLLTVVVGENSRGKTNLLEGVYFLVNGTGFRESKEEELVHFDHRDFASIEGIFQQDEIKTNFAITIVRRGDSLYAKSFMVNKTKKRHQDYQKNQTKSVLFSPEQIDIITGSPQKRREYLNRFISSYDIEYKTKLSHFEGALRKRNKILESRLALESLRKQLLFWDKYLEEQSSYLTSKRQDYFDYLNEHPMLDQKQFHVKYIKSELTQEKLEFNIEFESRVGRTMIGPQKDDFEITIKNNIDKNVHHFGSRSEQRLAILWLKMNEVSYHEDKFNKKPILLLDDVFSEFDQKNKQLVLGIIKDYQTILTTTESEILELAQTPQTVIKL